MKYPQAPFVELAFFDSAYASASASISALASGAAAIGFHVAGPVTLARGQGIRDRPFADIWDEETDLVGVADAGDLDLMAHDSSVRILQVQVSRNGDRRSQEHAVLSVLSISPLAALAGETHPVALWRDAGRWGMTDEGRAPPSRIRVLRRQFDQLTAVINPMYAAITVMVSLPSPTDLALDPTYGDGIFEDCWLRDGVLGSEQDGLEEFCRSIGAEVERSGTGVSISCYQSTAPERTLVSYEDRLRLNETISGALGRVLALARS